MAGSDLLKDALDANDFEDLLDKFDELVICNDATRPIGFNVEEYMAKNNWKLITEEWLARVHANGKGCSWMHRCASGKHWNLAKKTDAGRVRCKECGKLLDEAPQMLLELQKLKGVR